MKIVLFLGDIESDWFPSLHPELLTDALRKIDISRVFKLPRAAAAAHGGK
jgi:hypothetical protein